MPQNTIVRQAATALAVNPSDGTPITGASFNSPAALFVGTGGDINVYHFRWLYYLTKKHSERNIFTCSSYACKSNKHNCN